MLDLGVGAGRTTEMFAPIVGSYVGLDYAEQMIEQARHLVGARDVEHLEVGDARDLARWHGRDFDLVLFSFNGIDYVDIPDRKRILVEVRRVISQHGTFAFSTHSLNALPLSNRLGRPSLRDPLRSTLRSLRSAARIALVNRSLDLDAARARGYIRIRDGAHDFSIPLTTYVDPTYQVHQLQSAGFEVRDVLDAAGVSLSPLDAGREAHLFYICAPAAGDVTAS